MKSIDPSALWIRALMGTASVATRSYEAAKSIKAWLMHNPMALLGIIVIIIAIAMRVTGMM
jgi:hypothetical protein